MAQREGSVFVYLFVATLVLVVALVAAVLFLNAEKNELILNNKQLTANLAGESDRLLNTTKALNQLQALVSGSSEGWPGNEFFQGKLREAEEQINELRTQLGNTANLTYDSLAAPYKDFADLLRALRNAWDEQTLRAQTAIANHEKLRATTEEQLRARDDENSKLKTDLSALEKRFEDMDTTHRQDNARLTNQLAEQEEECTRKELEYKKQLAFAENRIQQLLNRLQRCEAESRIQKTIEDIEPDGQLLEVEPRSRIVWVNLGRRHHLLPGLTFKVYQDVGGKKHWKGSVEIRRIEDEYSEGRIVEELDPLNPLTTNDYVTSPFYSPDEPPTFVFAGDSVTNRNVSLEAMKKKLSSYGAKIGDAVTINTDFLVALANYENSPEYQTARELGVTILRETDVLEYMGY